MSKLHPEQQDDEIYLGNTLPEDVWRSSWTTSRLGNIPLCFRGLPLEGASLKPWFIKTQEVENKISAAKAENKPWSADTVRALEPLVKYRDAFHPECILLFFS